MRVSADGSIQPFVVVDRKWRVLLVAMFAFNKLMVRDTARLHAASALSARSQEEFSTEPIDKVVAHLVPLPHCDGLASAAGIRRLVLPRNRGNVLATGISRWIAKRPQ